MGTISEEAILMVGTKMTNTQTFDPEILLLGFYPTDMLAHEQNNQSSGFFNAACLQ